MCLFLLAAACSGCGNDFGVTGTNETSRSSSCWEWITREDFIGSGTLHKADLREFYITDDTTAEGCGNTHKVLVCWVPSTEPVTYFRCMRDHCHWVLSEIGNYEPDSMTVAAEKEYWSHIQCKVSDGEAVARKWRFKWKKYAETIYTQSQLKQHELMMDQQAKLWDFNTGFRFDTPPKQQRLSRKIHKYLDRLDETISYFQQH